MILKKRVACWGWLAFFYLRDRRLSLLAGFPAAGADLFVDSGRFFLKPFFKKINGRVKGWEIFYHLIFSKSIKSRTNSTALRAFPNV